jgi:hypothetical protein
MKKVVFVLSLVLVGLAILWCSNFSTAQVPRERRFIGTLVRYNNSACNGSTTTDGELHMMQYRMDGGPWIDTYAYTDQNGYYEFTPPDAGDHYCEVRAKPQCDDPYHGNCRECEPQGYWYGWDGPRTHDFGTTIQSRYCISLER